MVASEHILPVHMTGFMAIESEKRRPKWTLLQKMLNFKINQ